MSLKLPIAPIKLVRQYELNVFLAKSATSFNINLLDGQDKICLHICFRFTEQSIILNEKSDNSWGEEKRLKSPVTSDLNYKITIVYINYNQLYIQTNDGQQIDYTSRSNIDSICTIDYPPEFVDYPKYPCSNYSKFNKPLLASIVEDEARQKWKVALLRRKQMHDRQDFRYTSKIDNYLGIYNCLTKLGRSQEADNFILEVYQKNPNSKKISQQAVWALKRNNQIEKALEILQSQINEINSVEKQLDSISLLKEIGKQSLAEQELSTLYQHHPKRIDVLKACAYQEEQKQNWNKAIEYWQIVVDNLESVDDRTKLEYARCQLIAGNVDAAKNLVRETEIDWRSQSSVKAHAWTYQEEGNFEQARQYWITLIKEHPYFEFLRLPASLKRLDKRQIPNKQKEVRAFVSVRNEKLRIQEFLRHHRQIGIDRFFFIDNDSTDYTLLELIDEPDIHVFSTKDSFGKAGGGTSWQNQLLDLYGVGHWCVRLDIDEQFIYPNFETLNIHSFCEYLDLHEYDGVFGFMLDMYSLGSLKNTYPGDSNTLLQTCPYFDSQTYNMTPVMSFPPKKVTGGMRIKKFWNTPSLQKSAPILHKVPLVKWQKGFQYTSVAHAITPLRLADVSCLLLHYKFLNDFHERALMETQRKEMFNGGGEYKMYLNILEKEQRQTFESEDTARFSGSYQAIDLNLMQVSSNFNTFLRKTNNIPKESISV